MLIHGLTACSVLSSTDGLISGIDIVGEKANEYTTSIKSLVLMYVHVHVGR